MVRPIQLSIHAVALCLTFAGCPAASSQGGSTQVEMETSGETYSTGNAGAMSSQPAGPTARTAPELPAALSGDMKRYLLAVYTLIVAEWETNVLARASTSLPLGHPANRQQLVTEVAVMLDMDGQPATVRIARPSGYRPFDESAVTVMKLARPLPALPASIGEGIATLYWRFHRDKRSCSPAFAHLEVTPLTPAEAMRRALLRHQFEQAREILQTAGAGARAVQEVLVGVGLAAGQPQEVRLLALQLASATQLDTAIPECKRTAEGWRLVLAALVARKDSPRLLALLDDLAGSEGDSARLVELLEALASVQAKADSKITTKLLASSEPAVVLAAANVAPSADLLDSPLKRLKDNLEVAGPLAVRQRALGENQAAQEIVKSALRRSAAVATIHAITRQRLQCFDAELVGMIRSRKTPPRVRALAIEAIADRSPSLGALYAAILDEDPLVQIAGARALAHAKGNKRGISQRLAELASRARGTAQAEALAALASIGVEDYRDDTLRAAKRMTPERQIIVAAALGSYGEAAITLLKTMLFGSSPALREAAARGLARVDSPRARKLLAALPPSRSTDPPLQQLLQQVILSSRPVAKPN